MNQCKLLIASTAVLLLMGCSQKSDTHTDEKVYPIAAERAESNASSPAHSPTVEVSASTKPHVVADHRPIKLPEIQFETGTTYETFEIGSDARLAETRIDQPVYRYQPTVHKEPVRYAPSYPDRPVPSTGMNKSEVLAAVGKPANQMLGNGSEVWDYGTYRVFFTREVVAFTRVW